MLIPSIQSFGPALLSLSSYPKVVSARAGSEKDKTRILKENPRLCQYSDGCCAGLALDLLVQTCRRPVFQLHAERQTARRQDFLDFVQRLAAQIRRLEQLVFRTLDQ